MQDVVEMLWPLLSIYLDKDALGLVLDYQGLVHSQEFVAELFKKCADDPNSQIWLRSIVNQDWYYWMVTITEHGSYYDVHDKKIHNDGYYYENKKLFVGSSRRSFDCGNLYWAYNFKICSFCQRSVIHNINASVPVHGYTGVYPYIPLPSTLAIYTPYTAKRKSDGKWIHYEICKTCGNKCPCDYQSHELQMVQETNFKENAKRCTLCRQWQCLAHCFTNHDDDLICDLCFKHWIQLFPFPLKKQKIA